MLRSVTPLLIASCLSFVAPCGNAVQPRFAITVLVANRAGVQSATIAEMQSEAGWVLSKAGISTTWIDCPFSTEPAEANSSCAGQLGGTRFLVRLTRDHIPDHGSMSDMALGFSRVTPSGGSYATVLMDRVELLASDAGLSRSQMLGYAVAHEIGHMLMGSNSHSPHGLMRAGWKVNELRDMVQHRLLFSKRESERMRARITVSVAQAAR